MHPEVTSDIRISSLSWLMGLPKRENDICYVYSTVSKNVDEVRAVRETLKQPSTANCVWRFSSLLDNLD